MSDLFNNVKPGDMVHYKTPQGQHGKGKVVLRYDTHVVVNRGKGQPQVVNDNNYVKHERGGKVIGALLSRLKETRSMNGPYGGHPYDWDPELRKQIFAGMAKKVKQKGPPDNHRDYKPSKAGPPPRRGTTSEETILEGNIPKVHSWDEFHQAATDWAYSNDHHNGGNPKYIKKTTETDKVLHQTISIGHHPRSGNPYVIGVFNHIGGPNSDKGHGTHHHHTQGLELDEDSHDAEGKSARVAKTRRLKKKLHEVSSGTLASYVSKSIADRKKLTGMQDQARRIHTPERAAYFVDKAQKKLDKRSKGIKTAVGKIAGNLPAEKVTEGTRSEYDANIHMSKGAEKTAKGHYLMRDGRKLSGPHSPEEAVKAYKGLSSQGTDTKGVKIVHVKEGVEIDVTVTLITEDKVKEAAQKAISLAKKAKGNKHVDTEPKLDIQDKGTGGPMEANHDEGGNHAPQV